MKRKLAELINVIFGFRKFLLMLILFIVSIIFRVKGLINGAEFVDVIKTTTIAFFSVNGIEHLLNSVNQYTNKDKPQPTGPADEDESNDEEDVK